MTGFIRFFDSKIIKWFIIGTYTYFCLIILIEVIRRYIFGASSPWGEMTARYAFVYLTYVAAAEGIRQGRHIRIDLLPNRLPPATKKWLELYIYALTILLDGTVIYYSLELIGILWSAGSVMTAADVNMAFAHAALPLGWILIIIRIVQNWIDRSYGGRTSPDIYGAN